MTLLIKDAEAGELARQLAERQHIDLDEAVKRAIRHELARLDDMRPLRERLRPLQDRIQSRPDTGLPADKSFFDSINGPT